MSQVEAKLGNQYYFSWVTLEGKHEDELVVEGPFVSLEYAQWQCRRHDQLSMGCVLDEKVVVLEVVGVYAGRSNDADV